MSEGRALLAKREAAEAEVATLRALLDDMASALGACEHAYHPKRCNAYSCAHAECDCGLAAVLARYAEHKRKP